MKSIKPYIIGFFIIAISHAHFLAAQQNIDSIQIAHDSIFMPLRLYEDSVRAAENQKKLEEFFQLKPDTIKRIQLSKLDLQRLPELTSFQQAQNIQLGGNQIEKIKKSVWPVSDSLETIVLSSNHLKRIGFKKNHSITNLDLSENKLKRIPKSIRRLKHLKHLDLSKNEIKRIPCFIKNMDSLVELKLNYNQLKSLSKRDIRKLKKLKSIHFGANGISELPDNLELLTKLETLNLGINQINKVPPSFSQIKSLEHLIFYRNEFTAIPVEVWELISLKEIDFYHNHISEIPEQIGNAKKLEQIYLAYNQISQIPDTLFTLANLMALYLHHNEIIMVPIGLTRLQEMLYLDLGYNHIFEIPDLSEMTKLIEIDLQENSLSEFPYELTEIKSLRKIYLMGNPFVMTKEERAEMEKLRTELMELDIRLFF